MSAARSRSTLARAFLLAASVAAGDDAGGERGRPTTASATPLAFKLSSGGRPMPAVGFGTCCRKSASGPALIASTKEYLMQGGRAIDTAQLYNNSRELGQAIRESGVPRADIWVTSKVNTRPDRNAVTDRVGALASVRGALQELGTSYIDLMLVHGAWKQTPEQRAAVWRGLIDAKREGLALHLGVSNYDAEQIELLGQATGTWPVANELEYHPWSSNRTRELVRWCQRRGIQVIAYGSLGGSSCPDLQVFRLGRRACPANRQDAMQSGVRSLSSKYGVSTAQVLLRWALDQGVAVIPGATSAPHIRDNLQLKDFHLSEADRELLAAEKPKQFKRWNNLGRTPLAARRADLAAEGSG